VCRLIDELDAAQRGGDSPLAQAIVRGRDGRCPVVGPGRGALGQKLMDRHGCKRVGHVKTVGGHIRGKGHLQREMVHPHEALREEGGMLQANRLDGGLPVKAWPKHAVELARARNGRVCTPPRVHMVGTGLALRPLIQNSDGLDLVLVVALLNVCAGIAELVGGDRPPGFVVKGEIALDGAGKVIVGYAFAREGADPWVRKGGKL